MCISNILATTTKTLVTKQQTPEHTSNQLENSQTTHLLLIKHPIILTTLGNHAEQLGNHIDKTQTS